MGDEAKTTAQLAAELAAARRQLAEVTSRQQQLAAQYAQLNEVEQQQRTLAAALQETGTALSSSLRGEEVLDRILEQLARVVPHDAACVLLLDGKLSHVFRWRGYDQPGRASRAEIAAATFNLDSIPVLRESVATGRALVASQPPATDEWVRKFSKSWVKSYACAPIRIRGQIIGFLTVDSATPGFFKAFHLPPLQALAQQAALALENVQRYDQSRRERVKQVKALRKERNLLGTLLDTTEALVIVLDKEGQITRCNQAVEERSGYPQADLQGRYFWDLLVGEDAGRVQRLFTGPTPLTGPLKCECRLQTHTKQPPVIAWTSAPLSSAGHQNGGLVLTGLDITERKQAELSLQQRERFAWSVLDGIAASVAVLDEQGVIVAVNEVWRGLAAGYEVTDTNGPGANVLTVLDNVVGPDAAIAGQFAQAIRAILAGQQRVFTAEYLLRTADGVRWGQGRVSAFPAGGPPRVIYAHIDITDRKQAEESLRRAKEAAEDANQAKSAFLSNMSHELRTPLNGILGYTQIFQQDPTLSPKQQEGIDIIHRSGQHLLTMINDILDLSKIEANRMELLPVEFDFHQFLRVIVEMIRLRAEQKGLQFHYQPDPDLPPALYADETRLRQVLLNLLGNAVKFTRRGHVTFTVRQKGNAEGRADETASAPPPFSRLTFEVADTGSGIAPAQRGKIFEPFHQAGSRLGKVDGTGLGLSISQKLVELMGGTLHIESIGPDWRDGSRFWFEAPLRVVAQPGQKIKSRRVVGFSRTQGAGPFKILLADDSPANRLVLREFLSTLGFEVIEASNGLEAVAQATQLIPDLILMDLVMPLQGGLAAAQQIRQQPHLKATPIIAVSASISQEIRQQSQAAGCAAFLPKPFNIETLLDQLEQLLPLNWIYRQTPDQNAPISLRALVLPPTPELEALLKLAMIGDVAGIEERAGALHQQKADHTPFVVHLKRLAADCNLDELEQFIRDCLAHP